MKEEKQSRVATYKRPRLLRRGKRRRNSSEEDTESDGQEETSPMKRPRSSASNLLLKRMRDAAWRKQKRAKETEEEKAIRREKEAARKRKFRAQLNEEQRALRCQKDAENKRLLRRGKGRRNSSEEDTESDGQEETSPMKRPRSSASNLDLKRMKYAALRRQKRAKETEEEKAIRRQKEAARKRELRAQLNEEQRALRRKKEAGRKKIIRSSEAGGILFRKLETKKREKTREEKQNVATSQISEQSNELQEQQNLEGKMPTLNENEKEIWAKIGHMKILVATLKEGSMELIKRCVESAICRLTGRKVLPKKKIIEKLDKNGRKIYRFRKPKLNRHKEMFPVLPVGDNSFICLVCDEELNTVRAIKLHLSFHTVPELFEAKEKYAQTIGKDATKTHVVAIKLYDCELCSDKCCALIPYRKHLVEKHKENKELLKKVCFPCALCDEAFIVKIALINHHKYLHNIFAQCPICSETFETQESFGKHLDENHHDFIKDGEVVLEYGEGYFCKLCGICHVTYDYVATHFKEAHSENITFNCEHCQLKFSTKRSLVHHKHTYHDHEERLFCCELCGKRFNVAFSLRLHKRIHTAGLAASVQPGKKECNLNLKIRADGKKIRNQPKNQYETKEYECTICNASFENRMFLKRHKTTMCEKEKATPAPCPFCGKVLDNYILLARHKYHVHNIHKRNASTTVEFVNLRKRSKSKTFTGICWKCSVCGKKIVDRDKLLVHWRLHREETPFKCNSCGMAFKCKYRFYPHKEKEHGNDDDVKLVTDWDTDKKLKADFRKAHADLFSNISKANQIVDPALTAKINTNTNPVNSSQINGLSCSEVSSNLCGNSDVNNSEQTDKNITDKNYIDFSRANVPAHRHHSEDICNDYSSSLGDENVPTTSGLNQGNGSVVVEMERIDSDTDTNRNHDNTKTSDLNLGNEKSAMGDGIMESKDHTSQNDVDYSRASFAAQNEEDKCDGHGSTRDEDITEKSNINHENIIGACLEDELIEADDDLLDPMEFSPPMGSPLSEIDIVYSVSNGEVDTKPFIYGEHTALKDPFTKQLIVQVERLKECNLCYEFFPSTDLYRSHLNSKGHRLALRSTKKEAVLIQEENQKICRERTTKRKGRKSEGEKCKEEKKEEKKETCRKRIQKINEGRLKCAKSFPCPFCNEKLDSLRAYKKHTYTHKKKKKCTLCSEEVGGARKLVDHYISEHNGENVVKCKICDRGFLDIHSRLEHTRTYHGEKKRVFNNRGDPCEVCGEKIKGAVAFRNHLQSHGDFRHKCVHCLAEFKVLAEFEQHYQDAHHGNMPFACKDCPKQFPTELQLQNHQKMDRYCKARESAKQINGEVPQTTNKRAKYLKWTNKDQYLCSVCSSLFDSKVELNDHMVTHNKRAMCKLCSEGFATVRKLVDHYVESHNGDKLIKCKICDVPFLEYQPRNLREHMADQHDQVMKTRWRSLEKYSCDMCGVITEGKKLFKSHLSSHKKEHLECVHCNAKVKGLEALESHYKETHNGDMPFACGECPLKFPIQRRLQLHRNEAHPNANVGNEDNNELAYHKTIPDTLEDTEKVYCEVCGKFFFGEASLTIHKREHTGEKPYQCTVCKMAFTSPALLKQHVNKDHKKTCHPCDSCSKSFNRRKTLLRHCQFFHADSFPFQDDFICSVCSFRSGKQESLDKHMKFHDNARRHVCEICSWRFTYSANLSRHKQQPHVVESAPGIFHVRIGRGFRASKDVSQIIRPV